jgi:hypothetical protein
MRSFHDLLKEQAILNVYVVGLEISVKAVLSLPASWLPTVCVHFL